MVCLFDYCSKKNKMLITATEFEGLYIIQPKVFEDDRGYFYESYNESQFTLNKLSYTFVQDNEAKSTYGVIRGLHYQVGDFAQTKLVRVIQGAVLDIALDIRPESKTYGRFFSIEINDNNKLQILIPKGFAHGYSVLTETAIFSYKCDALYSKQHEGGINLYDESLNLNWKIPPHLAILSPKDLIWPPLGNHRLI